MTAQGASAALHPDDAGNAELHAEAWEALKKDIFVRDGLRRKYADAPKEDAESEGRNYHEKLMLWIVIWSWGLLMVIILGLHFGNYDLETKTSSKSPTHTGFYEVIGGNVSGGNAAAVEKTLEKETR